MVWDSIATAMAALDPKPGYVFQELYSAWVEVLEVGPEPEPLRTVKACWGSKEERTYPSVLDFARALAYDKADLSKGFWCSFDGQRRRPGIAW